MDASTATCMEAVVALQGSALPQVIGSECDLGAVPSLWFVADLLDASESKGQPREAIQDPVSWAYLVATSERLRQGPDSLGDHLVLPLRFFELLEKMIQKPSIRRSCLELRRFATIRQRVRDQSRIAWKLADKFSNINRNALWNASVFSCLGCVLLVNTDGTKAHPLGREIPGPGDYTDSYEPFKSASVLARDFCLNWNLPDWCLLWTTRMSWPAAVASMAGDPAIPWHLARIASYLEAQGRPTLNGVSYQGYADSCNLVGLDPRGSWRDAVLQSAAAAFPEREVHSGDYPEPDLKWIRIAFRQSAARTSDSSRLISGHQAQERELAIRAMETMQLELSRITFERVMAGMAEFTAGAGHEINNPLAIIQGRARQLHRSAASLVKKHGLTEFRWCLDDIQEQCRRLHSLLKKLMRFARPGTPTLTPVDVPEIVNRLTKISRSTLGAISFEGPSGTNWNSMPYQLTHLGHLVDAWTELCRNASFAAGEGGMVSMRVDLAPTGQLILRLSNSGPAIPDELKANLFTPFFSSRQAGRASGLGLPLAWRLLESIGAKLILESDGRDHPVCWKVEMPATRVAVIKYDEAETNNVRNAA